MPQHRGADVGGEVPTTRKDSIMWSEITCTDFDETTSAIPLLRGNHRNKKLGSHGKAKIPSVVGGKTAAPGNNHRRGRGIDHLSDYLHEVLNASRHKATRPPIPAPAAIVTPPGPSDGQSRRALNVADTRTSGDGIDGYDGDDGGGCGGGGCGRGIEKSASAGTMGEGGGGSGSRRRTLQRSGRHGKGHLREALVSILARANSEGSSTSLNLVPSDEGLVEAFSTLLTSSSSSREGGGAVEKEKEDGEDRRRRYREDARHHRHDRRKHLSDNSPPPIGYVKVFTGREAIDAIMSGGHTTSREEAVRLARGLERKYDPYEHVMGAHVFRDDYSLYRFRRVGTTKKSETNMMRSDADVTDETDTGTSSLHSSDRRRRRPTCARAFATIHGEVNLVSYLISTTTEEEVIKIVRTVEVRDRRHNLRPHEDCFVGRELVSLLVSSGCCKTREEAVLVGHVVGEKYDLFESVGGKHHDLEDSNLLYRFKENSSPSREWSPREAVVAAPANVRKAARRLSNTGMCSCRQLQERDVTLVWTAIFRLVDVRDRVFHFRTYKKCFVGSEVVDLLVMKALCTSRADGVRVIRVINAHLDLFEHVTGQHQFEDDYLFYRFKR